MSDSDLTTKVGMVPVVPSGEVGKEVASRVRKIVAEKLRVAEEKVVDEANFVDDLGADSLDQAELVMLFEEEFGCEIPEDAAEKITTIKTAIDFLKKHATL